MMSLRKMDVDESKENRKGQELMLPIIYGSSQLSVILSLRLREVLLALNYITLQDARCRDARRARP